MRPVIRPSIASDFDNFITNPLPYRVRAWTGLVGDEVVAVGGIGYMPDGSHSGFLMATDKAREHPIALHKAGLMVLKQAKTLGIKKLVTVADPEIDAAERWLLRLGFQPTMIEEQKVWVCSF
jgi:hypothetical protein